MPEVGVQDSSVKPDYRPITTGVSTDKFLGMEQPLGMAPSAFSFQNKEVIYGLRAIAKWAKESGGNETSGVLFTDVAGITRFRDLSIGNAANIEIATMDLSAKSPQKAREYLEQLGFPEKTFILVPNDLEGINMPEHIVQKGKKLLGSVHVHPSGNPPSGHDFANFLYFDEPVKGVIGDNMLYLFVKTKETPHLKLEPTSNLRSTTMHDYGARLEEQSVSIESTGIPISAARMRIFIDECKEKHVLMFVGKLEDNKFTRVV